MNYNIPLEAGHQYHIYNRAIGSDLLFFQKRNYLYFLEKYFDRLTPYLDTLAYCLIPNHFHLLVDIKEGTSPTDISNAFKGFFIGYSQAINNQENRKGSLFMKPFKRKKVENNHYLTSLFAYIHLNPYLHRSWCDFREYRWSSYQSIIQGNDERINYRFAQDWFGGTEAFQKFHQESIDFKSINALRLE